MQCILRWEGNTDGNNWENLKRCGLMKEKITETNLRSLLARHNIIKKHLKYTFYEILQTLDKHLISLERDLEKLEKNNKEQQEKIDRLSSPELWRFGPKNEAPPDYRAEYMRRLRAGENLSFGVKVMKNGGE
jgi:hypothetical protein